MVHAQVTADTHFAKVRQRSGQWCTHFGGGPRFAFARKFAYASVMTSVVDTASVSARLMALSAHFERKDADDTLGGPLYYLPTHAGPDPITTVTPALR